MLAKAILVLGLALTFCPEAVHAETRSKPYYETLPDYDNTVVFSADPIEVHRELKTSIEISPGGEKLCVRGSVPATVVEAHALKTNVCDSESYSNIAKLLAKLAPSLDQERSTFRKLDLDLNGDPELLVEQVDLVGDEYVRDPYLSVWLLRYDGTRFQPTYAGPFLVGEIVAELPFGSRPAQRSLIVRHQSCTECDPWVYLSVLDLLREPKGGVFQFTYAADHKDFGRTIEYSLPGMGHSVDADVETRVPSPTPTGPHLLQRFKLEDGTTEWWVFTCSDLKCDYDMSIGSLPGKYKALWDAGKPL